LEFVKSKTFTIMCVGALWVEANSLLKSTESFVITLEFIKSKALKGIRAGRIGVETNSLFDSTNDLLVALPFPQFTSLSSEKVSTHGKKI
jgi:hypothetical protein